MEEHGWSTERLKREVGEVKAQRWIDSGKLRWSPDELTGDDSMEMRVWHVPYKWRSSSGVESTSGSITTADEVGEDDAKAFQEMADPESAAGKTVVKQEPESAESILKSKVDEWNRGVKMSLRTWQDRETELRGWCIVSMVMMVGGMV